MADYKHGVYGSDIPTSITPPTSSTAGLTVVVGTAPIHLLDDPSAAVNKAILASTNAEAAKNVGYSDDFNSFTICEATSSHFKLFAVAPLVMINVLDPKKHAVDGSETVTAAKGEVTLEADGILKTTVVVKNGSNTVEANQYELEFDDAGKLHIYTDVTDELTVEFKRLDATLVTANDIIGGVDAEGNATGLELVNTVFPRFRMVPGILIAPKFSTNPLVAAVLKAKATNINGVFEAIAISDISTAEVKNYSAVPEYKNTNNLNDKNLIVCWPKVSIGGTQYHLSTQMASLANLVDAGNQGYPYMEASNNNLQMDSAVLEDGKEILLGLDQANYLNGLGIVTAFNFTGGWKLWGHRTSAYPSVRDPKDAFISSRRTFIYEKNAFILDSWVHVDKPGTPKRMENILESKNIDLNGKTASGFLLGGRIEFIQEENVLTDLMDGEYTFHLYLTPPSPVRAINGKFELDTSNFATLFN